MDSLFIEQDFSGTKVLGYEPWLKSGVIHGFIGKALNFSEPFLAKSTASLNKMYGSQRLLLLEQVHGAGTVDLRSIAAPTERFGTVVLGQGDSLIIPINKKWRRQTAFGIRTADCLPVIFKSEELIGLVHAGWRGLAAGVLQKTVQAFSGAALQAIVFPAASQSRYEVGSEVIAALEPFAKYRSLSSAKALLGLEETARAMIESVAPRAQVMKSSLCTISDLRFHSFRREGRGGSNLCFVIPD